MIAKYKHFLLSVIVVVFTTATLGSFFTNQTVHAVACTPEELSQGKQTKTDDTTDPPTVTCVTGAGQDDKKEEAANEGTTCAIQKIGWILCPVIETSGKISDQAFKFLAKTFLETQPELISNTEGKGTKYAWELARNLANIMFIIAFLIIIYSQVTGAGITNYGIKKMLPRIIVAAIAVNASYYICQIIVDLSNIMGYEIQRFMVDAAAQITSNTAMPIASGDSFEQGGGVLSNIAIAVLALGAIVYFLLPVLGAVISLVLITCLSIIIILLLRKAFIVLLIVAAPVAFVAYLLPNTEKYFQKWLSMFWKLLMVFPVVGMLLGAGQLASAVILSAGANSNTYADASKKCINLPTAPKNGKASQTPTSSEPADCVPGAVPFSLGLTAAGIAVIPLLAVWSVLKGALSAAGAIGGKIGATVSNMDKGRKANLSKQRAENNDYRKNRRDAMALGGGFAGNALNTATLGGARRGATRRAKHRTAKEELNRAEVDYVSSRAADQDGNITRYGQRLAGRFSADDEAQARVAANAVNAQRKLDEENKQAAHATVDLRSADDVTNELMQGLAQGNLDLNSARTAAMIERAFDAGSGDIKAAIIDGFRGSGNNLSARTVGSKMESSNPGFWSAAYMDDVRRGAATGNANSATAQALQGITDGRFGAEKMATASGNDVGWAQQIARTSAAAQAELTHAAREISANESQRGKLRNNRRSVEEMERGIF